MNLYKKIKNIDNLNIIDHPRLYSADDFSEYKSICNSQIYIFLGSNFGNEKNDFHKFTTKFNINNTLIFVKYISKIFKGLYVNSRT